MAPGYQINVNDGRTVSPLLKQRRTPNPGMIYGLRSHARRDRKKANLQATIARGIGIRISRRMRKQQSSPEGNSSIGKALLPVVKRTSEERRPSRVLTGNDGNQRRNGSNDNT
ncbi:Uncharacterized protein DBV15_04758 [Temnothorax longispinosus]|uniref:Uncharacterized protein n=1 Tax=Temnothorax longispinosus TaxID=300112 RepID=A0A4S2L1R8_9HYME|nr:Uncharacterized protein DBV15_04758 [Temnothorax longispinosus]